MTTTPPTEPAPREAVAAALEARVADLVLSVSAAFRNVTHGAPDAVVDTLARMAVAVVASSFGSDVSDGEIADAVHDSAERSTALVTSLFPNLDKAATITSWTVGIDVIGADGTARGFGMLTDRSPDFMHQAIAHELLGRVTSERHATGV